MTLTEWIKQDLYPAVYDRADIVFPEHNFNPSSDGWWSNTYLDGRPHDRADKTKITKKVWGYIFEQGGDRLSLIDYVMRRDNADIRTAVETLSGKVGMTLPKSDSDYEGFKKDKEVTSILEECREYFSHLLETSPEAKDVRGYLSSRGYSTDEVKEMGLGFIPHQDKLKAYLKTKGYDQSKINEAIQLHPGIGVTHHLSIPFRAGGVIKGFVIRRKSDEVNPKYLVSSFNRGEYLFNVSPVKGDKDLVVVEGYLDALICEAKGLDNVVGLGSSKMTEGQVKDAVKRGAKSFTLCLDTDKSGRDGILQTAKMIRKAGIERVYIASLPSDGDKSDPDSFIKDKGIEAFKQVLESRLTYGAYLGDIMLEEYLGKANDKGIIDYKERDLLRERTIGIRADLSHRDRIDFNKHLVTPLADHGFTDGILSELEESHKTASEEANRQKELNKLLMEVSQTKETGQAIDKLKEGLKGMDISSGKGLVVRVESFDEVWGNIASIKPSYYTGYKSLDDFAGIPVGGVCIVAGRPGAGKSTFMFNLMLRMSGIYKDKTFYFFAYEEPKEAIYVKLFSILIGKNLSAHFDSAQNLTRRTNYEFLKNYAAYNRNDIQVVEEAKQKLKNLIDDKRIQIIDKSYPIEKVSSLMSYLSNKEEVGAVFMDYAQRIKTDRKIDDIRLKVSHISDAVLQIAKENKIPVILGSQLNRESVKGGGSKKPSLEGLKETGNLEEDANVVLSVYNGSKEIEDNGTGINPGRWVGIEICALKNREGSNNTSTVLCFDRYTLSITEKGDEGYKEVKIPDMPLKIKNKSNE